MGLLVSLMVLVVLSPVFAIQKCCRQLESLNADYECTPSGHQWLYMNFTYGIPKCNYSVSFAAEGSTASCIDNLISTESIIALHCETGAALFEVPPVNYIRKCCPMTRLYDSLQQTCWGERTREVEWPQDFLNVMMAGFKGVVDIKIGAPVCPKQYVLIDYTVPYNEVKREESESIVFKMHDLSEIRLNPDELCLDLTEKHNMLVIRACLDSSTKCQPVGPVTCIQKCCSDGQTMIGSHCVESNRTFESIKFYNNSHSPPAPVETPTLAFFYGDPCTFGKYVLDEEVFFGTDGSLLTNQGFVQASYCLENVLIDDPTDAFIGDYFFVCFSDDDTNVVGNNITLTYRAGGMIISCTFLILTFIVYSCLPNLRNLHGKTLMCHIGCLIVAFASLSTIQIYEGFQNEYVFCVVLAYMCLVGFLGAFAWLNVISFDIWWTFGSMRPSMGRKARDRKRFIVYSIYAWGFAIVLTTVTALADNLLTLPENLRPNIGNDVCWFSRNATTGQMIFFRLPQFLILSSNIVFFTLTALHCSKVKSELQRIAHSAMVEKRFQADKKKLVMNTKLFIVMGVSWIFEVISWFFVESLDLWLLSDMVNALQGLIIFCIFILKKKVMRAFKRKVKEIVCRVKPKEHRPSTSTLFTVLSTEGKPHPLKKSTSDSRLSVGCPSPKRTHHRCMSSTSNNQLTVDHHLLSAYHKN